MLACLTVALGAMPSSAQEFRGIWVDAWHAGVWSEAEVAQVVHYCQRFHYNAVIVQVRRRGDAFYLPQPPNLEPRNNEIAAGFDTLREFIQRCHEAKPRIEVHCWTPTFVVWGSQKMPVNPGHVVNLHPEFLMENSAGEKYLGEGYYLDPGHPGATQWLYHMARDIVSRYDVDGFHWDYIRYPTTDSGYNAVALARYAEETGAEGKPAPQDPRFAQWRRQQVTAFLRWVNADLLALKPGLITSCSVFGSRSDAYSARFQDWAGWMQEGIVDVCMSMNYQTNTARFRALCDDAFSMQGCRRVYMGQGAYMNTLRETVNQLQYTRDCGLLGSVLYSYALPNPKGQTLDMFRFIRKEFQPEPAVVPVLPWKAQPTKALLKGTLVKGAARAPVSHAQVVLAGAATRQQFTEPHGAFAFFEVDPGAYTVTLTPPGHNPITTNVSLQAGQIVALDLAVDSKDTQPPAIREVLATPQGETSVRISWVTDEKTDGAIDLGGDQPAAKSYLLSVAHALTLTNLVPDKEYTFRVRATDASHNMAVSPPATFKTRVIGEVPDIILDNINALKVGTWTLARFAPDKFGADYVYAAKGGGQSRMCYVPAIELAGKYEVYEWHSQGTNRCEDAPHLIRHAEGEDLLSINQQESGGRWNLLGVFPFEAGTNGSVEISDRFTLGVAVFADAIKFVFVPPLPRALSTTGAASPGGN